MLQVMALTIALAAGSPSGLYFEQSTVVYAQGQSLGPGVRSRVWHANGCLRLEAADAPAGPPSGCAPDKTGPCVSIPDAG